MKTRISIVYGLLAVFLAFVFSTCTTSLSSNTALGHDELDATIREASDELNIDVPAGNFIGIINIQSSSVVLSEYIIDELIRNAVRDRNFTVVDRQRLDQIRQEHNFQLSGEVDDNLAVDIGRIIGLQTIVTGSVTPLGSRYRITVRALDVQTGAIQAQFNKNIAAGETIVALMQSGGGTTTASAPSSGGGRQAQAAAPSGPQSGTYIFFPRPQAYRNGVPISAYVSQVVVRGRHLVVHISDTARGPATTYYGIQGGFMHGHIILTNLDNPSRSWGSLGYSRAENAYSNASAGSLVNSFENATGTRFSMQGSEAIFEEIDLSKAEYEP